MKNSYYLVMYLILALAMILSCANHNNKIIQNFTINDEERIKLAKKELPISIDSIQDIYMVDGFPPYISSYIYKDSIKANITIIFTPKNTYWDIYNPNGFFAIYGDQIELGLLSNEIRDKILKRALDNYTITAIVTYDDVIKTVYGEDDLEYYPNMNLYQFIFEDDAWKFDKLITTPPEM